ncbi:MAG: hypothetical protein C0483_19880 [Pirellula sp.]|nr:hypothetical protein [Pirellula sp.]
MKCARLCPNSGAAAFRESSHGDAILPNFGRSPANTSASMAKAQPVGIHASLQFLATFVLVVTILYVGRPVLLPIGMAALGAFLLTPAIKFLERRRFPRLLAVVTVAALAVGVVVGFSSLVATEFGGFSAKVPIYRDNLVHRLDGLRVGGGIMDDIKGVLNDVTRSIEHPDAPAPAVANDQIVRVVETSDDTFGRIQSIMSAVIAPLAGTGVVLVLMVFVLLSREDLRNRIVRLSGKHFALTTRTLDDLGSRISRYLVAVVIVNGGYGAVVGLGLWMIGVDYAVLWGALAGVLRFIPYIGPAVGISLPLGMAFIQFPATDWTHFTATAIFLGVLETLTNIVVEPLTYGYSIGVSMPALLVAAIFWSWVWGPMGLLLSVPITVTLVVLGEYIPALELLAVVLGDKPALDSHVIYYQRLLAGDVEEAEEILDAEVKSVGVLEAYDAVAVRAVTMAERDLHLGKLTTSEHDAVVEGTTDYVEERAAASTTSSDAVLRARIIGCPVRDTGDEMALRILQRHLTSAGDGDLRILSSTTLASEMIAQIEEAQPDAVCLSSLGPLGRRQLRYLSKRVRQKNPQLRIIVGNWGDRGKEADKVAASLKDQCGANVVFTTLAAAHEYLQTLTPRPPVVPAGAITASVPESSLAAAH